MRLSIYSGAFASISSLASAGLVHRQSPANFTKLGGWVETMTIRSNGNLLLNRLDTPELWTIDPISKNSTKLLSFPGALGLTGIAEVTPDVFAVVSGNFNTSSFALGSGSYAVHKVDLTGAAPKTTLIKKIPESGFLIGVTAFNNETILIADAAKGALWTMNFNTGDYSVALSDDKMKAPASAFLNEGIHGVKYFEGAVYFTNSFNNTFNKVKIDATGKVATGVVTIPVSPVLDGPTDFVLSADGNTAYISTYTANAVYKVSLADAKAIKYADATQASSCAFGKGAKDKSTLYISTASGQILAA